MRKWFQSSFFSYFRLFLMLALAVAVVVGVVQYAFTYQLVFENVQENSHNSLRLLVNTHKMILDQMDDVVGEITDNEQIMNYMDYYLNDRHNICRTIIQQLEGFAVNNAYIDSISLCFPEEQYVVASDFGPSALEYYYDADFLKQLNTQREVQERVYRREIVDNSFSSHRVFTFIRLLPRFSPIQAYKACLVVNLDEEAIMQSLRLLSDNSKIRLLVLDAQKNIIAESGMSDAMVARLSAMEYHSDQTIRSTQLKVEDEEWLVESVQNVRGWQYYLAQPVAEAMGNLVWMRSVFFMICAVAFVTSILLSYFFSHKVFQPVRQLQERVAAPSEITNRYSGEMQQIINRVDAIIARNVQLENERKRSQQVEQAAQYLQLLRGDGARQRREEMAAALGLGSDSGLKWLVLLHGCTGDDTAQIEAALRTQDAQLVAVVHPAEKQTALFVRASQLDAQQVQALLADLQAEEIAVSAPFVSGADVWEVYSFMLRQREHPFAVQYDVSIENDLLYALKNRNIHGMRTVLDAFLLHLVRGEATADTAYLFYKRLYRVIVQLVDWPSEQNRHMTKGTLSQMDQQLEMLGRMTIEHMTPPADSTCSPLIQDVCDYIVANLSENLSIDALGERFYINPAHLRKTFQNEMGITIKRYIDRCRLASAKELLCKKELKIQDIAYQLGFRYSHSFISFFRSAEGITPGEYQAQNAETEEEQDL